MMINECLGRQRKRKPCSRVKARAKCDDDDDDGSLARNDDSDTM